jgi:hypothetical protein
VRDALGGRGWVVLGRGTCRVVRGKSVSLHLVLCVRARCASKSKVGTL